MILQLFESGGVFIGMTRHEQQQPRILVSKSLILFRKGTPSSAKTKFVFWSTPFSIVGGGGTAAVQRIEVSIQFEVRVIIMSFQQRPALKRGPSKQVYDPPWPPSSAACSGLDRGFWVRVWEAFIQRSN